jgi:hypothetical protein
MQCSIDYNTSGVFWTSNLKQNALIITSDQMNNCEDGPCEPFEDEFMIKVLDLQDVVLDNLCQILSLFPSTVLKP